MLTIVSGTAIALSAFLTFWIQLLFTKAILPKLGGAAAVWISALVTFQVVLFLGYWAAHELARYPHRRQLVIFGSIALFTLIPLFATDLSLLSADPRAPVRTLLTAFALSIGASFFLLSTVSTTVQSWLAGQHGSRVYHLYALSNAGSLLALVLGPTVLERFFPSSIQYDGWRWLFVAATVCVLMTGLLTARSKGQGSPSTRSNAPIRHHVEPLWISLPVVSNLLLVGTTSVILQRIAPLPLLWVLPLATFLISYIVAFLPGFSESYGRKRAWLVALSLVLLLAFSFIPFSFRGVVTLIGFQFIASLVCHAELARRRPPLSSLTTYYLSQSFGGAVGGVVGGFIIPFCSSSVIEFPLALALYASMLVVTSPFPRSVQRAVLVILALVAIVGARIRPSNVVFQERNFFGVLSVTSEQTANGDTITTMLNGSVVHGVEVQQEQGVVIEFGMYGPGTGISRAFELLPHPSGRHIGIVGLGAGILARYAKAGDSIRFYEINPLVERVAHRYFAALSASPAAISIVIGDGRIVLEQERPQHFDLLVLDAFSGGGIPVHLLTTEAFGTYRRHLSSSGIIALHYSNNYLDLAPVIAQVAEETGFAIRFVRSAPPNLASWALLFADPAMASMVSDSTVVLPTDSAPWSDDYTDLLSIVRF